MAKAILLSAVLLALVAVPALGQTYPIPEDMGLNYSISFGASLLANGNMLHTRGPAIGFAFFDSAGEDFGQMAAFGLSADWTQIERSDGTNVQVVPLLFNYRQYAFISSYRVFANVGVGVLALSDSIAEMKLSSGVNFGWMGGLGFDVTNNLFVQARFIGGSDPGQDGMTFVQLGYRF